MQIGPVRTGELPQWLVHFLAMLIHFLLKNMLAMGLRRSRRRQAWWQDRPDLPAGSAQAEAASVRGQFGNADRLDVPPPRHRAGASGLAGVVPRHRGVWRQPGGVPCRRSAARAALVGKPRRRARHGSFHQRARRGNRSAAATAGCCECSAAGAERHASCKPPSGACKIARVMVGRNNAAGFRACRPQSVDRAATLPGTAKPVMSDARGRSTAGPAVLIRAV